ncbi:MAG: AMP-binding protein [Candidatus Obscuribacter sp.]|nr:AMP-binding protein [Candidatus Obscuribacter sp.]
MNIVTRLKEIARLTPHKAALVDLTKKGVRQISYSQLFMLTRCYAQNLRQYRLDRGAVVLLMMPLSLEFFAAMLAVNSLGLVAMVVDPASGLKSLLEAVSLVKPALIVVGKNLLLKGG